MKISSTNISSLLLSLLSLALHTPVIAQGTGNYVLTEENICANGSLTRDGTRRIQKIEYDLNNNPVRIQFENGSETQYVYGAGGAKLRVIHLTAAENGDIHSRPGYVFSGQFLQTDTIDYAMEGTIVYRNGRFNRLMFDGGYVEGVYRNDCVMPPVYPGLPADELAGGAINTEENGAESSENAEAEEAGGADVGRGLFSLIQDITGAPAQSVFSSYLAELKYRYYTKDHLGNNREIVGMNGEICQLTDYYPYGMPHTGVESECNPEAQPYKYNGKELDGVHGLNTYDYGARQYGFAIPRWDRVDPLCEKYYHASPYAYCLNNPVNAIDPDGKVVIFINGMHNGLQGGAASYWNGLDKRMMNFLNDRKSMYYDGAGGGVLNLLTVNNCFNCINPLSRYTLGYVTGMAQAQIILSSLSEKETIKVVTHSMGAMFGKGFIAGMQKYAEFNNIDINSVLKLEIDLAPYQPYTQKANSKVKTYTLSHKGDIVAGTKEIENATNRISRKDKKKSLFEHSVDSFTKRDIEQYINLQDNDK